MSSGLRDAFRRGTDLVAIAVAGLLLLRLYAIYACVGLRLNQDAAEHLHVAFALERGERPYLDFIENHPMLFNLGILALKRAFPQDTVLGLYMLVRLSVFLAFAGCIYYVYRLCVDYCRHEASPLHAVSVLMLVFVFFGILPEANSYLWDARPDWFCYLLSLACIHAHYRVHGRSTADWTPGDYLALGLGGMAGGLATAVLAKSLYIFAPYAVVAGLIFAQRVRASRVEIRRLLAANALFAGIGILVFCVAVAGELSATGATLDAYYKANFVINRATHLVGSLEATPSSQLVAMAAIGPWPLLFVASAAAALLLTSFRERRYFRFYTLVFAFLLIGFNILLLASTNAAYWFHGFAPSLLGLLAIGFVLLHSLLAWLVRVMEGRVAPLHPEAPSVALYSRIGYGTAMIFFVLTGFSFVARVGDAARDFENLEFSRAIRELTSDGQPAELLADRLLPAQLTYLVFSPDSMSIRARHWGYFFMLGPDRGFWMDNYNLGIGPDPKTYWRDLYATAPPDAVLFSDITGDFIRVRERLLRNQGVDISWLSAHLKRDYICIAQPGVAVYVRPEHMLQFSGRKWTRCGV